MNHFRAETKNNSSVSSRSLHSDPGGPHVSGSIITMCKQAVWNPAWSLGKAVPANATRSAVNFVWIRDQLIPSEILGFDVYYTWASLS